MAFFYMTPYMISKKVLMEGRKCLFNDALNTFYLRLYGVTHMVMDHSDSETGNPLPPQGLLFYMHHPTDITYHGLCYTSRGALAGTKIGVEGVVI